LDAALRRIHKLPDDVERLPEDMSQLDSCSRVGDNWQSNVSAFLPRACWRLGVFVRRRNIGDVTFHLVGFDSGGRQEGDNKADFAGVFDFDEAFAPKACRSTCARCTRFAPPSAQ